MQSTPKAAVTVGITIGSDYRVVGYNPEMADMDHPRGELVREVFFLLATGLDGDRWAWGGFMSEDEAIAAILTAPPALLWAETYPEYGSPAYVAYGADDEREWEARHVEAERFNDRFYVA